MTKLALALCLAWFGSLFVFRTISQLKNTGTTGIKGFHGAVGSLPWLAGACYSAGLVLAPLAPIATLYGWLGGGLFVTNDVIHALGALIVVAGICGALLAQLAMGDSWRVGVDESESTELVTTGLFACVRNPIFSFVLLSLAGLLLLVPNSIALVCGVVTLAGTELQVRAVEEPYLERTHGDVYRTYCSRVGRFLPRLDLFRAGEQQSAGRELNRNG